MSAFDLFTERLRLKPFEAADRELLVQFYGDPAVMSVRKFGVLAPREAAAQLEEIVGHWSHHGFGMYAVRSITDERFLGECGLRWLEDGRDVEVSYGLWPDARGSGLATEASRRVLTHGFEDLGLEQIIARGRANNLPSRRVMDKLGMTLVFEQPRDDKPPLVEYSVTKKAWADAMARIKNNQENEP
jgi:ribosomal-protein-alanine N-acetyltransferase